MHRNRTALKAMQSALRGPKQHVIVNSTLDTPRAVTYRCACGKQATYRFLSIAGHRAECDGQQVRLVPIRLHLMALESKRGFTNEPREFDGKR